MRQQTFDYYPVNKNLLLPQANFSYLNKTFSIRIEIWLEEKMFVGN